MFDNCKTNQEVNKVFTEEQTKLFDRCGVFFAFSQGQLREGLEKIGFQHGKHKVKPIGAGGYCFSHMFETYEKEFEALIDAKNAATKRLLPKEKIIMLSLQNFECFYTGDIEDAYESDLKHMGYTLEECWKVYHDNVQYQ